jgi:serine/threonine protein kinase/ABC-type branched-subunit amino acid transport system substrate-binding protein
MRIYGQREGISDMAMRTPDPLQAATAAHEPASEANDNTDQQAACSETFPRIKQPTAKNNQRDGFAFLEPARDADELGWLGVYRVVKLLGKGGMGIVFVAEDTRLCREVALKVMHEELASDETSRHRFTREARATATIRSDHIVAIHEIGEANSLPYIVTELLQGQALDTWLSQNPAPAFAKVLEIGLQIARGLEASHRAGVIHRDIKPANLWMEEPSGRIKILDFGLARAAKADADLTQDGAVLGTPAYMAPEQAEGKPIDARCDLFSLGCVLYLLASGKRAFDGPNPIAVMRAIALDEPTPLAKQCPNLPPAFCQLVMQLLAKDPNQRPASASVVVAALQAIKPADTARPAPAPSAPPPIVSAPRRTLSRRQKRLAGAAGLLGLLTIVGVLGIKMLSASDDVPPENPPHAVKEPPPAKMAHAPSPLQPGVTEDEILLGVSAPFSGPARELGRAVEVGMRTYFDHVNDQGGIAGRKIKLVALDDCYQPERALANTKELLDQRRVFAIIGNVGTATAESAMPYARSKQRIFFGAFTGAALLRRDPPDRYVFNYRASYAEETAALVRYMIEIKELRPDQIAVFAQQDAYGNAGFDGVVKTLRKFGHKPELIVRVGHARNSNHVGDAVEEIKRRTEIRAVVMVSTYRPAAEFIRQLKDAKRDLLFANISFVGSAALAEELVEFDPAYAAGVIVSQVVPHPACASTLALKYRDLLAKYHPNEQANFGSLEGYINAAIFTEGLRRAGRDLTTESLVDALESIRSHDLGLGTPIHYGPSGHQASHKVWGTILDASGRFQTIDLE